MEFYFAMECGNKIILQNKTHCQTRNHAEPHHQRTAPHCHYIERADGSMRDAKGKRSMIGRQMPSAEERKEYTHTHTHMCMNTHARTEKKTVKKWIKVSLIVYCERHPTARKETPRRMALSHSAVGELEN